VAAENVSGRIFFQIPQLGGMISSSLGYIRSWFGLAVLVALPAAVIIGTTIRDTTRPRTVRQKRLEAMAKRRRQWQSFTH
jgi:hypothetical protein